MRRFKPLPSVAAKRGGWVAFTAVFAVLAGFVFWGTWSTDFAPVMPDCPTSYSTDWVRSWFVGWMNTGKFVPGDVKWFLGTPYFWQELQYVIALYCSGLALAYFLKGRGLSDLASYGAGLFLSFSGYWSTLFSAGHLGWFQWMTYGVFAFGLIDRALEKGKCRHWVLLGAVVAWASFYQPDLWLLFTVFTAAYFVFRTFSVLRQPQPPGLTFLIKGFALCAAVFILIGLPSFYSAIFKDLAGRDQQISEGETISAAAEAKASESADAEREKRWIFVTNWSLPPAETVEFFNARVNGDTSCPMTLALGAAVTGVKPYTGALGRPLGAPQGNYRQHSLYVGWLTCLLALLALVSLFCRKRLTALQLQLQTSTLIFFSVSAILFYLLSLGRYCEPVYRVVFSLPMGDYLRAPVKWHHLTEFCLVVLAGFGLEMLRRLAKASWQKGALVAFVLVGAVDLARNDRLYCAPQPHNYQVQLADARQVASPQARQYLAQQGVRVLGLGNGIAAIGKYQRPTQSSAPLPSVGIPTVLGLISFLASVSVLGILLRR